MTEVSEKIRNDFMRRIDELVEAASSAPEVICIDGVFGQRLEEPTTALVQSQP